MHICAPYASAVVEDETVEGHQSRSIFLKGTVVGLFRLVQRMCPLGMLEFKIVPMGQCFLNSGLCPKPFDARHSESMQQLLLAFSFGLGHQCVDF